MTPRMVERRSVPALISAQVALVVELEDGRARRDHVLDDLGRVAADVTGEPDAPRCEALGEAFVVGPGELAVDVRRADVRPGQ